MKVIFVNRYFHPDHSATSQILSDLVFALAAEGREVAVVSSRQCYEDAAAWLPGRENIRGVSVRRVWTSRYGRLNLLGRAVDYLTFYTSAAWVVWRLAAKGDIVVAMTDPPMLSVVVEPVVRMRRAKLVNWLQDIFPEVAQVLGVGNSRVAGVGWRLVRGLRDGSLRRARNNVVLGDKMAARLKSIGVASDRMTLIPNWSDGSQVRAIAAQENALRAEWGLGDEIIIGYSGNLGRAHEYETIVEAISRIEAMSAAGALAANVKIGWLFIGGGARFGEFQAAVARRKLRSVRFRPYQPRERLSESLSAADVHIVTLRPELEGLIVPSKYYGIAAAGRPAIFIGDERGEIAGYLRDASCGVTIAEGDVAAMVAQVLALATDASAREAMGRRARAQFEARFDKATAVAAWARLIDRIEAA